MFLQSYLECHAQNYVLGRSSALRHLCATLSNFNPVGNDILVRGAHSESPSRQRYLRVRRGIHPRRQFITGGRTPILQVKIPSAGEE